jgi:hypothetical protein
VNLGLSALRLPCNFQASFGSPPDGKLKTNKNQIMTKLSILAVAALASSAFAGQEISAPSSPVSHKSAVIPQEACFGETELQVDLFGMYLDNRGPQNDGFGGGVGVTYFFHRNFGLTADVSVSDSELDSVWQFQAGFVARYPFEIGNICLAPYAKVTGGIQSEDGDNAFVSTGLGLEWRATSRFGVFAEANYGWLEGAGNDFLSARTGIRFVF